MGLAGGIVRRVFSKSPCSSAGGSRGHSEKGSAADHRRRWRSLRLYLCGEEMNAAAEDEEEDGDDTVSVKSFETCCVMPPEEAPQHVVPVAHHRLTSDTHDAVDDNDNPGEPAGDQGSSRVPGGEHEQSHCHVVAVPAREEEEEEGAATLIQSAFRGFMARRQLQELKMGGAQDQEPTRSPTWASVATSVLVQVGEQSLSNLRLMSEESASVQQQQQRSSQRSRPPPPPAFRVKEEWDDSTASSNVSRMRMQSRIEATTRRERALAYAFSKQLRSCGGGGSKKRSARSEGQAEFNVGWSWLERWMATRQAEPAADDCMSRNADTGSVATAAHRRVVVVRRRSINDLAVEEKESCGSNDVSVVSFDGGSSSLGGGGARSGGGLGCHKLPGSSKSRLKGARSLPRRKQVAASDHHRFQARSHKVSKKGHQRVEQDPHRDRLDAGGFDDAYQPPTDY